MLVPCGDIPHVHDEPVRRLEDVQRCLSLLRGLSPPQRESQSRRRIRRLTAIATIERANTTLGTTNILELPQIRTVHSPPPPLSHHYKEKPRVAQKLTLTPPVKRIMRRTRYLPFRPQRGRIPTRVSLPTTRDLHLSSLPILHLLLRATPQRPRTRRPRLRVPTRRPENLVLLPRRNRPA